MLLTCIIFPLCVQTPIPRPSVPVHLFKPHEFRERQFLCNIGLMALAFLKYSIERGVEEMGLQNLTKIHSTSFAQYFNRRDNTIFLS